MTVLQEYMATQGQLFQTWPIEGAEVKFYGPFGSRQDLEAIEFTNSEGKVTYEYEYRAIIPVKIMVQGNLVLEDHVILEVGETTQKTFVIPE